MLREQGAAANTYTLRVGAGQKVGR